LSTNALGTQQNDVRHHAAIFPKEMLLDLTTYDREIVDTKVTFSRNMADFHVKEERRLRIPVSEFSF
jgi:hypothetical protein